MVFRQETGWHQKDGRSPLWRHNALTDEEAAHHVCWAYTASAPLRSALLMRSVPLWYRFGLSPAWVTGHATRRDRLVWDARSDTEHDQVVELLTRSAARIPDAVYREKNVRLRDPSARLWPCAVDQQLLGPPNWLPGV